MDHGAFRSFEISASGLTAQRRRLDAIADNIANAQTTRTAEGGPYQRREVTLSAEGQPTTFRLAPSTATTLRLSSTTGGHQTRPRFEPSPERGPIARLRIEETRIPGARQVYDPGHPDADEKGLVSYPDISIVQEMVEMILASRAYEANVTAIQSAKAQFQSALEI
jgi:flagellar basal-body rod protein FlgC